MHGKEFLTDLVKTYFILVTLITVAMLLLGSYFEPETRFGYAAFASPLLYALCGTLPNVVMYARRELTIKEVLIRKVIQLIVIEALVLTILFHTTHIETEQPGFTVIMGISIFAIYVFAHIITWFQDYLSAKQMTEELIRFQQHAK